jgi:glycosyltransferase involved in cell wall biosynthesis
VESKPEVSVVVPMKNAAETIGETVAGLQMQDFDEPFEVIFVDNGSTDGSADVVVGCAGRLREYRIVSATDKRGAAYARNAGAGYARGALIAFCDADDVAEPGWLRELVAASEHRHAVGGSLAYDRFNTAETRQGIAQLQKDELPSPMAYLPYSSSANFLVPTAALHDVGGWDESFDIPAGEDADLSWRLQEAGHQLRFASDAVIQYRLRGGLLGDAKRVYRYTQYDVLLYSKHRKYGARARSYRGVLWSWFRLVLLLPSLIVPKRRRVWFVTLAKQLGWLRGSVRFRTLYL